MTNYKEISLISWINALIGRGSRPMNDKVPKYFTGRNKDIIVCSQCYNEHWGGVFDYKEKEFVCPACANGKDTDETSI